MYLDKQEKNIIAHNHTHKCKVSLQTRLFYHFLVILEKLCRFNKQQTHTTMCVCNVCVYMHMQSKMTLITDRTQRMRAEMRSAVSI